MSKLKESVISIVKNMPEDVTIDDIIETLYIEQKILKGQKQLREGQYYSHEEAREMMEKWLR